MTRHTGTLDLLTFNLTNPSREQAERQLAYLAARPEPVLVLTETADSAGCDLLESRFSAAGYYVVFPRPPRPSSTGTPRSWLLSDTGRTVDASTCCCFQGFLPKHHNGGRHKQEAETPKYDWARRSLEFDDTEELHFDPVESRLQEDNEDEG
ncbi:hypothetical protein NRF20_13010 [Streptomyces sp. R-74717]|uniref:hypothetical protein n=1 Tax=Streptomyces sp. R-74717 TaxID=2969820 RepID=UPI0039B60346